jgi:hypothetical protein
MTNCFYRLPLVLVRLYVGNKPGIPPGYRLGHRSAIRAGNASGYRLRRWPPPQPGPQEKISEVRNLLAGEAVAEFVRAMKVLGIGKKKACNLLEEARWE